MTRDLIFVAVISLLTGLLFTVHVLIIAGLFARRPLWPGIVAIAVPPLAPIFAYRAGLRVRAYLWAIVALAYFVLRLSFSA